VSEFARHAFEVLLHFGVVGLIVLSILDSSFLFLPIGNDLLLIALVSQNSGHFLLYAIGAAAGSVIGVWTVDVVSRRSGEEGLTRITSKKRLDYLKKKMKQNAAIVIVLACLAPPPFPFTAMVAAASALQYPRLRLFVLIFSARLARFLLVALAAIYFHEEIMRIVQSNQFWWFMEAFAAVCIIGSAYSIVRWWRAGLVKRAR
jgi:membrane protein YqaA with SNARE-associated domain